MGAALPPGLPVRAAQAESPPPKQAVPALEGETWPGLKRFPLEAGPQRGQGAARYAARRAAWPGPYGLGLKQAQPA